MRGSSGDEPQTLRDVTVVGCHSYMKPSVEICLWPSLQHKRHKGEHFFLSFVSLLP